MSELAESCQAPPTEFKLIPVNPFHRVIGLFNLIAVREGGASESMLLLAFAEEWKWQDLSVTCALAKALNENAGRILNGRGYAECI